jgi:hypothetical protein
MPSTAGAARPSQLRRTLPGTSNHPYCSLLFLVCPSVIHSFFLSFLLSFLRSFLPSFFLSFFLFSLSMSEEKYMYIYIMHIFYACIMYHNYMYTTLVQARPPGLHQLTPPSPTHKSSTYMPMPMITNTPHPQPPNLPTGLRPRPPLSREERPGSEPRLLPRLPPRPRSAWHLHRQTRRPVSPNVEGLNAASDPYACWFPRLVWRFGV